MKVDRAGIVGTDFLNSDTRSSFLAKLKDGSSQEDLWPVFVDKYGKAIFAWCRRWGASSEDAEDILQMTLLQVFLKVERFEHGGRYTFRAWLRQIARNLWLKVVERSSRTRILDDGQIERLATMKLLKSHEARQDLLSQFDQIACDEIRCLAFERVRQRVNEVTWQAYVLNDHERMAGKEIAEKLGVTLGAVRVASFRVRNMLTEELTAIDPPGVLGEY